MTKTRFTLLLIILIAWLLRLWGIFYDLPYIYHPDEPWPIRIGYFMLKTGDFNPHFFHWPSFIIYINLLIQTLYYFLGKLFGFFNSLEDVSPLVELIMGVTYSPTPIIVALARLVSVSLGVGAVVLTVWVGRKLTRKPEVGLLAGMMMAISPTNVSLNKLITPDSYATFFIVATFCLSVLILQQGQTWLYIIAGICLGLAISSKYNSGLVVIVLFVSHFLRHGFQGYKKDYPLYLALLVSIVMFLSTSPYVILDFRAFYTDLMFDRQHYATGHAGMEGNTLQWYLKYLGDTTGPIYLLAVLSIIFKSYLPSKEKILLIVFPLLYFAMINSFVVRNDRTIMPLMPFLYLLAAVFLTHLFDWIYTLPSKTYRSVGFVTLTVLIFAVLTFSGWQTITKTIHLTTRNSRETARVWIEENLPAHTKIALEAYSPFVNPQQFSVQGITRIIDYDPEWYIANDFEYLVFGQDMYGRYYQEPQRYSVEISQYNRFFERFEPLKIFTDGGYEVRIYKVRQ